MSISFDFVPSTIRVPGAYAEVDNSKALRGLLPAFTQRILVIGQRHAAGSVAAAVPTMVLDSAEAAGFFGQGSMLHRMLDGVFANNSFTETWGLALDDDGAAVAATGTVEFTAASTEAGTFYLYVGGRRVKTAIGSGDAVAVMATALAAAVNADADLAVTAGAALGVVTLTARNKGEAGNYIDIRENYLRDETAPAGLAWTIVGMAGGVTNPDVATAIAAIGSDQYEWIVMPWTDTANLTALTAELADRWQPLNVNEGHAFAAKIDTVANLSTFGNALNSPHLSVIGVNDTPTPPEEIAAAFAGQGAFALGNDPARPLQTLPLYGVKAPPVESRFTITERNILLFDGVATVRTASDGTVMIERAITTYQKNAQDIADPSYLDITTLATVAYLRKSWRAVILQKFPRHKLADDGTRFGAGQAIVTPGIIRGETIALARQWEDAGLVENLDQFKEELIVVRNGADPTRVDLVIPPDLVNQARVFAAVFQFIL